jgi:predicted nucleotidyltransferase component of viral defense system
MRALYQRKKGRDLFDLWVALRAGTAASNRVVECFRRYMEQEGLAVSRAEFEANLAAKLTTTEFREDTGPLVSASVAYDPAVAAELVHSELVSRLPGKPWKGRAPWSANLP